MLGVLNDPLQLFHLFIEISVALLGFSGVVAAFGGRNRDFTELEQTRLLSVFSSGIPILTVSLAALICFEADLGVEQTVPILGVVGVVIGGAFGVVLLRKAFRFAGDQTTTTNLFDLILALLGTLVVYLSFFTAIFTGQLWLVVLAFAGHLLSGMWVFFRLLTRRN